MRKFIYGLVLLIGLSSCNDKLWDEIDDLKMVNEAQASRLAELQRQINVLTSELDATERALYEALEDGDAINAEAIVALNQELINGLDELAVQDSLLQANIDAAVSEINATIDTVSSTLSQEIDDVVELLGEEVATLEAADLVLEGAIDDALQAAQDYADANDEVGGYDDTTLTNLVNSINTQVSSNSSNIDTLSTEAEINFTVNLSFVASGTTVSQTTLKLTYDWASEDIPAAIHTTVDLPTNYVFDTTSEVENDYWKVVSNGAPGVTKAFIQKFFYRDKISKGDNHSIDLEVFIKPGPCMPIGTPDILVESNKVYPVEFLFEGGGGGTYTSVVSFTSLEIAYDDGPDLTVTKVEVDGQTIDLDDLPTARFVVYTGSNPIDTEDNEWIVSDSLLNIKITSQDECGNTYVSETNHTAGTSASNSGGKPKKKLIL